MTEPVVKPNVLVVGADMRSLGIHVVQAIKESEWDFGKVTTAGISGEEWKMDLRRGPRVSEVLTKVQPDIVVCTVGVNHPVDITSGFLEVLMKNSFDANVTAVMNLLRHFVASPLRPERVDMIKKFVAISSNSARLPRRNSVAYCASKAALSMALRVAARELAGRDVMVWGYEPGLLDGTPMTHKVLKVFYEKGVDVTQRGVAMHRMPGVPPEGLDPRDLARLIVHDLATAGPAHNGLMIPFDAGEL
jgi:NAD(P)-dependent dehydrogenase (short-subunit alcohol dehydrogenase family)